MLRKYLTWAGIAFLIFFVAFKPDSAAEVVYTLGNTAVDIMANMGDFFSGLVGG